MCCPPKQVDVVRLSHSHAAWRRRHVTRAWVCGRMCVCVCLCPRVCLCVVWVSTDITFLTRTPLPTSGAGWCTRSPQTQTGQSSWPHHYNEAKRCVVSFQSPGGFVINDVFYMWTHSSSGVSWMGSLVNWASKLSSPNSPEMLGLKGGTTCFCSSWKNAQEESDGKCHKRNPYWR